jgi:hypothetical protein
MNERKTTGEIERWFAERRELHAARERAGWEEYLRATQGCDEAHYGQSEALAWRRLRRALAEVAHLRRRDDFELDRALADTQMWLAS